MTMDVEEGRRETKGVNMDLEGEGTVGEEMQNRSVRGGKTLTPT